MTHIAPKKSLGQNFLRDQNIAHKIVAAVGGMMDETVVEIGPGEGALTALLLNTSIEALTAVEFDERAVALLQKRFVSEPRFYVHQGDVLRVRLAELLPQAAATQTTVKVVGNIPYYITSDILIWLFDQHSALILGNTKPETERRGITKAVIMMQKEVAERLVAKPRTKEYGTLTLATAFVAVPKVLFHVAPGCFYPKPNVTSSVVEFVFKHDTEAVRSYQAVQPLVRVAFNQRRKMLSNALSAILSRSNRLKSSEILAEAHERGITYFQQRAEELTAQDFIALYGLLQECGCVS